MRQWCAIVLTAGIVLAGCGDDGVSDAGSDGGASYEIIRINEDINCASLDDDNQGTCLAGQNSAAADRAAHICDHSEADEIEVRFVHIVRNTEHVPGSGFSDARFTTQVLDRVSYQHLLCAEVDDWRGEGS